MYLSCVNLYHFLLILLYPVSSLASTENGNISQCIVPPKPDNGDYITDNLDPKPGVVVETIFIIYNCNEGYELVGPAAANCTQGVWAQTPHTPECIPHCDVTNASNIVSCGAEQTRCIIPRECSPARGQGAAHITPPLAPCARLPLLMTDYSGENPTAIQEMPWHAAIYTKTTSPYMQICGGTLVTGNVVISAAHCFWDDLQKLLPAANYAVALGKEYRPWADTHDTPQRSDVRDIKVPPRFQGSATNFQDDIALVFLRTPVKFSEIVNPACLSFDHALEDPQLKDYSLGKVGGWGLTSKDGQPSTVLQTAQLPYVDIEKCIAESPSHFVSSITSDKFCAGYKNDTAVCKGDSGGGLLFPVKEHTSLQYYLRGIVSTTPTDDHLCNVHAWATFTLLSKHERFIRDNLLI